MSFKTYKNVYLSNILSYKHRAKKILFIPIVIYCIILLHVCVCVYIYIYIYIYIYCDGEID